MKYQKLTVGNIRRKGDETHVAYWRYHGRYIDGDPYWYELPWEPVSLVGWPILPADLFTSEFRRPL